ncbi:MAG: metallophosphoesterase [Chloroflexota bacterium]
MSGKTLVIGDTHGCFDELQALLDTVPLTADDRIIHIGDMIDRGPHPEAVTDFFMSTPQATSIMGNREDKHIRAYDGELSYEGAREMTRQQFSSPEAYATAVEYMRTLPLYIDLPEATLVHGYFEPGVPLAQQQRNVLLGHTDGDLHLEAQGFVPFYEHYAGEKPLVFGHREYPFLQYQRRAYAIDTRCVYGGTLTGLLLPDFKIYGIPAREDHWMTLQARFPHIPG